MEKIAVIGMSCLFPGAETAEQFFENLLEQKDLTSLATKKQMGVYPMLFFKPQKGETDKYYNIRGGFIHDFQMDSSDLDLSDGTLQELDEVYQWSLYVAREALRDSGYLGDKEQLARCGVLLGNLSFPTRSSNHHYLPFYHRALEVVAGELLGRQDIKLTESSDLPADHINTRISGYPAALIAKALHLSAINFSLDAACASSLYSVKLACDYLNSGKADLMLAGAVSAADPFFVGMGFSCFQAYPLDGDCRPLDQNSEGLVAGEGAGMFVLKRYEDAVRDGDQIYAAISGVGLSNDGRGKFVLSPKPDGQILAFERAYKDGPVSPNDIG